MPEAVVGQVEVVERKGDRFADATPNRAACRGGHPILTRHSEGSRRSRRRYWKEQGGPRVWPVPSLRSRSRHCAQRLDTRHPGPLSEVVVRETAAFGPHQPSVGLRFQAPFVCRVRSSETQHRQPGTSQPVTFPLLVALKDAKDEVFVPVDEGPRYVVVLQGSHNGLDSDQAQGIVRS